MGNFQSEYNRGENGQTHRRTQLDLLILFVDFPISFDANNANLSTLIL